MTETDTSQADNDTTDDAPSQTPKTHIAMILDCSGSMAAIEDEARQVFNQLVEAARDEADDQDVDVSLVLFETEIDTVLWNEPVDELPTLEPEDYHPGGVTTLLDAVGHTITRMRDELDQGEDVANLVLVVSDGRENNSEEYDYKTLNTLVEEVQDTGRWTISYFGSDGPQTERMVEVVGIPVGNVTRFVDEPEETARTSQAMADSTRDYLAHRDEGRTSVEDYAATVDKHKDDEDDGDGGEDV